MPKPRMVHRLPRNPDSTQLFLPHSYLKVLQLMGSCFHSPSLLYNPAASVTSSLGSLLVLLVPSLLVLSLWFAPTPLIAWTGSAYQPWLVYYILSPYSGLFWMSPTVLSLKSTTKTFFNHTLNSRAFTSLNIDCDNFPPLLSYGPCSWM